MTREEGSNTVLWEIAAGTRVPQIWRFTLREEITPVEPVDVFQGRRYRVVRPQSQHWFALRKEISIALNLEWVRLAPNL
jgi:hypothetical protein